MKRITKNELEALNSGLAARIVELRTMYEQALADNVRLRTTNKSLDLRNEELSSAHDAQCTLIDELEATIRLRTVTESAPTAARGVASPVSDENTRDDALADRLAAGNPTAYVEDNEFRMDTLKRIRIKYRCTTRYNREIHQYEIYRDGAWMLAPR